MRFRVAAAVVAAFLSLAAGIAGDPVTWPIEQIRPDLSEVVKKGDGFVHQHSGYVFPAMIADMPARRTTTYGDGDASVNYSRFGGANGDAWIDVFVYPAALPFDKELEETHRSLAGHFDGKAIARPPSIEPPMQGVAERWYEGRYAGVGAITAFRISKAGSWFIKVRVTIPTAGREDALVRAGKALQSIEFNPRGLTDSKVSPIITEAA